MRIFRMDNLSLNLPGLLDEQGAVTPSSTTTRYVSLSREWKLSEFLPSRHRSRNKEHPLPKPTTPSSKTLNFIHEYCRFFFGGPRATPTREYFIPQCIRRECTSHALTWWTDSSLSLASLTVISCRKAWNRDLHKNKKRQNERIASSLICTTRVNCCNKVAMASQKF